MKKVSMPEAGNLYSHLYIFTAFVPSNNQLILTQFNALFQYFHCLGNQGFFFVVLEENYIWWFSDL